MVMSLKDADIEILQSQNLERIADHFHSKLSTLKYYKDDTEFTHAVAVRLGNLKSLYSLTNLLTKRWRIKQADAIAYILNGSLTYTPPLTIENSRIWDTRLGQGGRITITINDPAVTPEQVSNAYKEGRKEIWGIERGRYLGSREAHLVDFSLKHADLNQWDKWIKWQQEYPEWEYPNDEAMRKAYERAEKKLMNE